MQGTSFSSQASLTGFAVSGRAGGEHQRDLVLQDQVVGHLAGAVRVALAVLQDDLHVVLLAADR